MAVTEGDQFKNLLTGKSYSVTRVKDYSVILGSEDGLNQVLTCQENLGLFYEKIMNGAVRRNSTSRPASKGRKEAFVE